MDQIDAKDAKRFLLFDVGVVEHADMQNYIVRRLAWRRLQPYAHPSVALVALLKALCRDRVGEGEESRFLGAGVSYPRNDEVEFALQHAFEATPRYVAPARFRSVDFVAELHVVGRHGFCDRSCGGACLKEPPRDLLTGADLDNRAVFQRVEIDGERLFDSAWRGVGHGCAFP